MGGRGMYHLGGWRRDLSRILVALGLIVKSRLKEMAIVSTVQVEEDYLYGCGG